MNHGRYTTTDVARLVGADPLTVVKWFEKGWIKGHKTPGGHRRIEPADLRQFFIDKKLPMPPELEPPVRKLRLLVVDDYAPFLSTLKRSFRRFKDEVELFATTSGVEALLLLPEFKPDAMLIDILMPGIDGFEVCRRVRQHAAHAHVKLIAMTGDADAETCAGALKAGAVACLDKPFEVAEVMALMRGSVARVAATR